MFATEVLLTSGMALSFPFFALYLSQGRGLQEGSVGGLLSVTLFLAAVSQAMAGELSDSLGRRRVMMVSMWLRAGLVLLLAASIARESPTWVVFGLHMASVCVGNFFGPAARGWIADHCPPAQRLRAYGLNRVGVNLGWAIGPAAGGLLAGRSYAGMFLASAVACALCAVILSFWLRDREGAARSGSFSPQGAFQAARDRRFVLFCAFSLLIGIVMSQMVVPLSMHAVRYVGLSEVQVGLLFSLNGLIVVGSQYPVCRALSRRRITSGLALGSVLYALGYGSMGFAPGFAAMAAAMAIVSIGEVVVTPGLQALAANMAPEELRGRYVGFNGFMHQAGFALGPLLGGLCIEHWGSLHPAAPWLVVAGVGLIAALGFNSLRGRLAPEEEGLGNVTLVELPAIEAT